MRNGVNSKVFKACAAWISLGAMSLFAVASNADGSVLKAMKAELDRSMKCWAKSPFRRIS